jgi:hypothetical protein
MLASSGFVDLAGVRDFIDALQGISSEQPDDLDAAMITQGCSHPRPSPVMCAHARLIAIVG